MPTHSHYADQLRKVVRSKGRARLSAAASASCPRDQSAEREDEPWQSRTDNGTRDRNGVIEGRDEALVPVERKSGKARISSPNIPVGIKIQPFARICAYSSSVKRFYSHYQIAQRRIV